MSAPDRVTDATRATPVAGPTGCSSVRITEWRGDATGGNDPAAWAWPWRELLDDEFLEIAATMPHLPDAA